MKTSRLALFLSFVLAACGSEGPSGSGGTGGSGGNDQTVTLSMGPFTVPPGGEVYKCQFFKNPFNGADTDIKTFENHMTTGSHHMFLFLSQSNQDAPLADCQNGGFEFHPYVFTSGSRDTTTTYPDTIGMQIPGNQGLEIDAHYLNTTQQTITATVTTTMHIAPAGSVTQHAGVIFFNDVGISIPPGGGQTSSNCNLPIDMNFLFVASHMHSRGTHFVAKANGTVIDDTMQWADPSPAIFSPAMHQAAGTTINWGCTYDNETNQTLTFGESAQTNVMCILTGQYYPVPAGRNPLVQCMAF
jgi:hypothetical protein